MTPVTVPDLIERLTKSDFLTGEQLRELRESEKALASSDALAEHLVERKWLTSYQVDQLLLDRLGQLTLGGFRLLEPIGSGGMGEVFRALQVKLNRSVAIKLIRKEFAAAHTDALARFRREALAVAKLAHPNIVVIFDADECDGTHYLVMEYVAGQDLSKYVKEHGALPVEGACECIRQAALGLQHAHEHNLVHRDIKPSNLLLVLPESERDAKSINFSRAQVKILDLGLARINSEENIDASLTRDRGVMGTPDYISPEQARDPRSADIRSDLYSLGCTFYYLLAGHPPFPNGTSLEKVMCHQLERPRAITQLRPDVPQEVSQILRKLLSKARDDRYQTPAALADELGQHLGVVPRRRREPPGDSKQKAHSDSKPTVVTSVPAQDRGQVARPMLLSAAAGASPVKSELFEGTVLPGAGDTYSNYFDLVNQPEAPPCQIVKGLTMGEMAMGEYGPAPLQAHCIAILQGHRAPVATMAFAGRGKFLATGGLDHSVRVWVLDGSDFRQATAFHDERLGEIQGLAFCCNQQSLLVAASGFGGRVWKWRWQDRLDREMQGLEGGGGSALSLSSDGAQIAAAERGTAHVWRFAGDQTKYRGKLEGRGPDIVCTAFGSDGQSVYTGNAQGIVQSWRMSWRKFRPECAFAAHVGPVHALATSPDGRHIATAGTDNAIRIWTLDREPELVTSITAGLRGVARRIQFYGRGESLVAMTDAGQIAQWRTKDAFKEAEWRVNQIVAMSQAIADNGRVVAVGRTDGAVHVYALGSSAEPPKSAVPPPAEADPVEVQAT
jgi:serine/threonine-protein kinase